MGLPACCYGISAACCLFVWLYLKPDPCVLWRFSLLFGIGYVRFGYGGDTRTGVSSTLCVFSMATCKCRSHIAGTVILSYLSPCISCFSRCFALYIYLIWWLAVYSLCFVFSRAGVAMNSAQQDLFIGDCHVPSFNHTYFVCFSSVLSLSSQYQQGTRRRATEGRSPTLFLYFYSILYKYRREY